MLKLLGEFEGKHFMAPSWTMDSGRGIQAGFRLKTPALAGTPAFEDAIEFARRLEQWFRDRADPTLITIDSISNANRQTRLAGGINKKTGRRATILRETLDTIDNPAALLLDVEVKSGKAKAKPERSRGSSARHVAPNDEDVLLEDLDNVWQFESLTALKRYTISEEILEIIEHGETKVVPPDRQSWTRSQWLYLVVNALERAAVPESMTYWCITNPAWKISDAVLTLPEGGARPAEERYAIRQIAQARRNALADGQFCVRLEANQMVRVFRRIDLALGENIELGIYQRGSDLARVAVLDKPEGDLAAGEIARPAGSAVLLPITVPWLRKAVSASARVERFDKREECWLPVDPPKDVAETYLASAGEWGQRPLRAIVCAPTLLADGSILQTPGYHAPSRLLYLPALGVTFPAIPDAPTYEQALNALALLRHPFRAFPWATPADETVHLAAVLTALTRTLYPAAPLFLYDASTPRSGKSKLVECDSLIALGRRPAHASQGESVAELEKRLGASLLEGDPLLSIDNVERPLESSLLCSMLTQAEVKVRILGQSRNQKTLPSQVTLLASGNNVRVLGDLTVRTLSCRLDADMERPEDRVFDFSPEAECIAQRGELVAAALTILKAYGVARCPAPLQVLGGFEDWNKVREALCWVGMPDPAITRERVRNSDTRRAEVVESLEAWHAVVGEVDVTVAQLLAACDLSSEIGTPPHVLFAWLQDLGGGEVNARKIGWRLGQYRDCIFGGLRLEQGGEIRTGRLWRVRHVQ